MLSEVALRQDAIGTNRFVSLDGFGGNMPLNSSYFCVKTLTAKEWWQTGS